MSKISEITIHHLNYLMKTYEEVTQTISKTKQRLLSIPGDNGTEEFDPMLKGEGQEKGLESVKGRLSRALEKELKHWDIWNDWLEKIPGVGPYLAARLIIFFFYRFSPVCKECGGKLEKEEKTLVCVECGKKSKDGGLLQHKIEEKDFATISKWWAYMGRHTVDGVMPKRKKGELANWSTPGRTVGFHVGDQFNRQKEDHPYKKFMLERKRRHETRNPEWSKGHIHNAAKNEAVKLFLSHFWTVARTIEGKEVSEPYAGALMGHTNIIKPFYWDK